MTNTINEFTSTQQKNVELFCKEFYGKNKMQQLVNAVLHRGKKWWSYGVVAIVAHALTGPNLWSPPFTKLATTQVFLVELTLWSAGVGIAWYVWLSHLYGSQVNERSRKLLENINQAHQQQHNNVWVMASAGRVLGVAILRCDTEKEEGQIKVAALESRIELALVQNVIQFARQQGIKVITQEHSTIGTGSIL